jgi:hypothetical protein
MFVRKGDVCKLSIDVSELVSTWLDRNRLIRRVDVDQKDALRVPFVFLLEGLDALPESLSDGQGDVLGLGSFMNSCEFSEVEVHCAHHGDRHQSVFGLLDVDCDKHHGLTQKW